MVTWNISSLGDRARRVSSCGTVPAHRPGRTAMTAARASKTCSLDETIPSTSGTHHGSDVPIGPASRRSTCPTTGTKGTSSLGISARRTAPSGQTRSSRLRTRLPGTRSPGADTSNTTRTPTSIYKRTPRRSRPTRTRSATASCI